MTEWKEVKLGDVCLDVSYGYTASATSEKIGPKFLRITDVVPYFIHWDDVPYCNIPEDLLERYLLKKGDIVIARTGATSGYNAVIDNDIKAVYASYLIRFRPNPENVFSFFMKYVLKSEKYKDFIKSNVSGSAQPGINAQVLSQFSFSLPPLDVQRKIAGILGALDDKIEVLRAQNKTLEQMAQAVFQSWFVDFDIVRAKAAGLPAADVCKKYHITPDIYDLFPSAFSADNLPLGWEKKKLGDMVCNVKENIKAGKETIIKPYVPIDCISSKTLTLYESKSGEEAQSSLISFRQKDILFGAMRAYFHKVCIAPYEGTTRSTAFVLRPYKQKDLSFSLLSVFQKNCIDFASMNSKGSTMPYAVWDHCLSDYQTEASSSTIRDAFNNIVEPYLDKLIENSKQIRTLEQTRDTLLPQLISGNIEV